MNASTEQDTALPAALSPYVDALRATPVNDATADVAQARLEMRIGYALPTPRTASVRRVWWFTAAGFATLLAVLVVPALLMRPGDAFAQVQDHLRNFATLTMQMDTRAGDTTTMHTTIRVDHAGSVRVDVDKTLSVIVNAQRNETMQLLHDAKMASVRSLAPGEIQREDSLRWLDDLRTFQGQARELPDTREIAGTIARGWVLDVAGAQITLWADDDNGLPIAMDMAQGSGVTQTLTFDFDAPMPVDTFDTTIPAGYTAMAPEADG